MRGGIKTLSVGITLVLFLVFSNGIQSQGTTWENYSSIYEYTEVTHGIYYLDGEVDYESTYTDTLQIWNVTISNDKVFFRTNFTPYFMGLMEFESQQEYEAYLDEHYWYDNVTDSMSLAYSIVGTDFYLVDMMDCTLTLNATIVDYDIRMVSQKMFGLFIPVNHTSFNFKTVYTQRFLTEASIDNVKFKQQDDFVIGKMKYDGYYLSLEYSYSVYSTILQSELRSDYKIKVMYSPLGELYQYELYSLIFNTDAKQNVQKFEITFTLDPEYRLNGTEVSWVSSLLVLGSLLLATYAYSKGRKD